MTQRERIIELLNKNWLSNFQIQQALKSSSADREVRRIRENPPDGYVVIKRIKEESPVRCFEYRLVKR